MNAEKMNDPIGNNTGTGEESGRGNIKAEDHTIISQPNQSNGDSTTTNSSVSVAPPNLASARPPTHSSAPSISFTGKQNNNRPASISTHNRSVTPHTQTLMDLFAQPPASMVQTPSTPIPTSIPENNSVNVPSMGIPNLPSFRYTRNENDDNSPPRAPPETPDSHTQSLMSLFAQRANTPTTPTTPTFHEYGSVVGNTNTKTFGGMPGIPPLDGSSSTPRRQNSRQRLKKTNNQNDANIDTLTDLSSIPRPAHHREKTDTTRNLSYHRQDTPQTHNRDTTMVAANLRQKGEIYQQQSLMNGTRDDCNLNEKTALINTVQQLGSGDESAANDSFSKKLLPNIHLHDLLSSITKSFDSDNIKPTIIGSFLFSLYQLVFCFAEASAITRPSHSSSNPSSLLSPVALMACMGSLLSGPMLVSVLGGDYPALYPCLDMFMAPFLAQMAADIDEILVQSAIADGQDDNDDTATFLATFVALNTFGMLLSGILCIAAGKIKLANLGGYLPYPVLCGFFSSVGISVWMSAFKVDTGTTIQNALAARDWMALLMDFARHAPSLAAGGALYVFGPRGPHFLLGIIASTVLFAYVTMAVTGTSLEDAQDMSFFWKQDEVMMTQDSRVFKHGPPDAFGLWSPSALGKISWPAFKNGLGGVIAMSIIYLLRCTLHAAALSKVAAKMKTVDTTEAHPLSLSIGGRYTQSQAHKMEQGNKTKSKAKPKDLLTWYANSLFAVAFSGGFAVLPAIALGGIFSKIGAKSRSPQFGAMILLFVVYITDFSICSYIPKCTFSSLLVLAACDLIDGWFIKSYKKSQHEWIVVPIIVTTSLTSGMLQSVGLGLAASTLVFVASFYRAGVVKYIANGLTIRSTIERNHEDNQWLDQNGDLIQVLVLQNYLFFGNASSCLKYIQSMFDDGDAYDPDLPPIPKHIILDLSIVTGIDTSAVDILDEIVSLCKTSKCKLTLAGIPRSIRPQLITGGVKPSLTNKHVSFSPDLEAALGKAEDELLRIEGDTNMPTILDPTEDMSKIRQQWRVGSADQGLHHALREIDSQHNLSLAKHLASLVDHTTPIEIKAGDSLNGSATDHNLPTGLYFVESGLLRCEHDSSASLTRGRSGSLFAAPHLSNSTDSIGQVQARSATVGRCANLIKKNPGALMAQNHVFRLARIGPGWVIGSMTGFMGKDIPGTYVALTPCRVHHLNFETIEELELEQPVLILHLYKLYHTLQLGVRR